MGAVASALGRIAGAYQTFFFGPRPTYGAVSFRFFLAIWTMFYYLPRFRHAEELYCRPVLREPGRLYRYFSDVPPSLALVYGALTSIIVLLVVIVVSDRYARIAHTLLFVPMTFIFTVDTLMTRAYGDLAFIQWGLLWAAPYDRAYDQDGHAVQAPLFGVRLIQLQFSTVYISTVGSKVFNGVGWVEGWALKNIFNNWRYGDYLLSTIDLPGWMYRWMGWSTLVCELFIAFGIWFKWTRKPAMFLVVAMHTTMIFTLRVSPLFHLLMMGHLLLFVRPEALASGFSRLSTKLGRGPSAPTSEPHETPTGAENET